MTFDPRAPHATPESSSEGLWSSEQLVLCNDAESGLRAAIAIDDTTLGPALGGVRYVAYPTEAAAIREAQRLGAAMTLKNAAAGLPFGGGKTVIYKDRPVEDRVAFMRAFGRFVARLGGTYLPGVDMGTGVEDLREMEAAGAEIPSLEDPSPWTAVGVFAAVQAAVRHVDGRDDLDGVRLLVQGTGHVGASLARQARAAGASVLVSDIDGARAAALAAEIGGVVVDPGNVLTTDCDVFAPCAIARVLDPVSVPRLRCRIVAGAANDTLSDRDVADAVAARGIVYVPDFVANAGGVIHIHAVRSGWDVTRAQDAIVAIGDRVTEILTAAADTGSTPLAAAERSAAARISAARRASAVTMEPAA